MSVAVAKKIPMGPCQIYWNNVRLGSPKSQASFRYTKETVQAGLEDHGLNIISRKTKEVMEVDVVIGDFDLSNLKYVYDAATGFDAVGTISTNAYSATASVIQRYKEELTLIGTTAGTLARAGFISGTVTVWNSEFTTSYTRGTDWTGTAAVGTVGRESSGDITDGDTVYVEYNLTSTVSILRGGGQLADFEAVLLITHEMDGGKLLQFRGHRAKHIGASDAAISMAAEFSGVPMTFHLLGDLSKNPGIQLFEWTEET